MARTRAKPNTSIALQTRLGSDIPNEQAWGLGTLDWREAAALVRGFSDSAFAQFVSQPCPIYNCHGLTFASRRTQPDEESLGRVLSEDGYRELGEQDEVRPGDVVLYYDLDGDVTHSGIVVDVRECMSVRVPFVWSKWGHWREVIHNVKYCPYDAARLRYFRMG